MTGLACYGGIMSMTQHFPKLQTVYSTRSACFLCGAIVHGEALSAARECLACDVTWNAPAVWLSDETKRVLGDQRRAREQQLDGMRRKYLNGEDFIDHATVRVPYPA